MAFIEYNPHSKNYFVKAWGKTGKRLENGRCSECGGSAFVYNNGMEFSKDGIRGYRCLNCGTIKPEAK